MQHDKKTILIIGGAGYIGSHTAWLLAQKGFHVVIVDDLSQTSFFSASFSHRWAEFIQGDYGDSHLLTKLFTSYRIEAVMHFAAFTVVSESVQHPLNYYHNNVSKTVTLLDAMVKHNVLTMIFSSSCAVYGCPLFVPLTEGHPCVPISPYGTTKHMIEVMLKECEAAYGLQYVALRYFNAAGALPYEGLGEQHLPETHGIPLLLQAAATGKPFYLFGTDYETKDGTCIRDYVHVCDIADAHYKALLHLIQYKNPSDIFNLGSGVGYSVKELIAAVEYVSERELLVVPTARRKGDPAVLVADPTKAMTILRWKPLHSDLFLMIKSAWLFEQSLAYVRNLGAKSLAENS
jgi:UDP-glucose 4-epimerase